MADTKKKKKKKRAKVRVRFRHPRPTAERRWHLWNHDVDTLLHELVKNPALATVDPDELVARAESFADALHAMQNRRRPEGVPDDRY